VTRVAVAVGADPDDPHTWSGIPYGLQQGLRTYGIETVGLEVSLHPVVKQAGLVVSGAVRLSRYDAWYTRGMEAARNLVARRRFRRLPPVDAAVVGGADFRLPDGVPVAIWADLTVVQARRHHPVFAGLSDGTFGAWRRRQDVAYRDAVGLAAASHWTARSMVDDHGADPAKVHVVGFGINRWSDERLGGWDSPRFLFVGREFERKNGPAVLRAFGRLREERPDARLDVVGGHPRIDQEGVVGHGTLALNVPEQARRLDELFGRATCFVMPSLCEPFGIAYAEAGRSGVPSIATAVGGARTILGEDGGLLVDPYDDGSLLDAMRRLCDPQTAQRMGAAARARAGLFHWDVVAGRMLRALGIDRDDLPAPL
jgi:glycosyltransferase involved in cell wall biosynthesis